MASNVKMQQLLETGVHFGHRTNKWNPKMDEFIFGARNGIHIIDLRQTLQNINDYYDMIVDMSQRKKTILFVGTKRQAQEIVAEEATRCGMPYVNSRWLGGTMTNWRTIQSRINTLKKLENQRDAGEFDKMTKREQLLIERKIEKLEQRLGGLRNLNKLPDLLVVVDTEREDTAIKEANTLNIPVLGIVDTNADPDVIDYIVPANDDAMRSIRLMVATIADAIIEGRAMRKDFSDEEDLDEMTGGARAAIGMGDDADDDEMLGEATLKKLRDAKLFKDEETEDDDTADKKKKKK